MNENEMRSLFATVWSARLLGHLDNNLVALRFFNRDYEGDIRNYGDTVVINQVSEVEVDDYEPNQDMKDPDQAGAVGISMPIDQKNYFNFQIDDVSRAQARVEIMDAKMNRAAFSLGQKQDRFLFNLLAEQALAENQLGVATPITIQNSDDLYRLILQIRTRMSRSNVPQAGRVMALPPEALSMALEDDRFVNTGSAEAEDRLQNAVLTRGLGFDIVESNNTPGDNTIVAGHPMGATYANQLSKTRVVEMEKRFATKYDGLSVYGAMVTMPSVVTTARVAF